MLISVKDIIEAIGGRIVNSESLDVRVDSILVGRPVPLNVARQTDLAFFFSKFYERDLLTGDPGILVIGEPFVRALESAHLPLWKTAAVIACQDPSAALAILSEKFASSLSSVAHCPSPMRDSHRKTEVHPTAIVAPTVELGEGVVIGPYCVIEGHVQIGSGTVLYPHCTVGPRCVIGEDCVLFPNVTLYEWTVLGNRVRLHSGVVLGADGFGYAPKREGKGLTGHLKIYHLGRVVVGNDVEIGALSCVDRGTLGDTRIENHVKIDNQVHLGHNTRVDEGAVICGASCLAGSASVGKYAYIGGLSGIDNQVHVGDGAKVGAMSLITKDVPPGAAAVGNPQRGHREHFRAHAMLNKLLEERKKK